MAESTLNSAPNGFKASFGNMGAISGRSQLEQTRIFVIGRRDLSLHGLASILESHNRDYLVSCVEPDDECMEKFAAAHPDALLVQNDSLPDPFEQFLGEALRRYPDIRILVFGKDMDDNHLYNLVRAGVHGYINERMDGDHFVHALTHILDGNSWIERHILERFIADQQGFDAQLKSQLNARIDMLCEQLTRREIEILNEVIKGLAIKQIAEHVHLSHQGVKMHLAKLFKKFSVANRNQLILAAFDVMSPGEDLSVMLRSGLNRKLGNHKDSRN